MENKETMEVISKVSHARFDGASGVEARHGCLITFYTDKNVKQNDYVLIEFHGNDFYFNIASIDVAPKNQLKVEAYEFGSWKNKLSKNEFFDLRHLIDVPIKLVTDPVMRHEISEQSRY